MHRIISVLIKRSLVAQWIYRVSQGHEITVTIRDLEVMGLNHEWVKLGMFITSVLV